MNLQIEREDKRNLKENIQTLKTSPTRERLRKILGMLRAHHLVVVEHQKFFSTAYPAVLARCTTEELAHGGHDEKDRELINLKLFVSIEHLRAKFSEDRPTISGRHQGRRRRAERRRHGKAVAR
jgi:hypothetical protein